MKKRERQYRDAALGAFIGYVGILLICLILVIGSCGDSNREDYNTIEEPMYGTDTTHVITEDGVNWYTTHSQDDGDTLDQDTLLKNYWIPNTQIKIKNIK